MTKAATMKVRKKKIYKEFNTQKLCMVFKAKLICTQGSRENNCNLPRSSLAHHHKAMCHFWSLQIQQYFFIIALYYTEYKASTLKPFTNLVLSQTYLTVALNANDSG